MKLLFDQNLSPRLARTLAAVYPGTTHVRDVGLQAADDGTVWVHAAEQGFAILVAQEVLDLRRRVGVSRKDAASSLGESESARAMAMVMEGQPPGGPASDQEHAHRQQPSCERIEHQAEAFERRGPQKRLIPLLAKDHRSGASFAA